LLGKRGKTTTSTILFFFKLPIPPLEHLIVPSDAGSWILETTVLAFGFASSVFPPPDSRGFKSEDHRVGRAKIGQKIKMLVHLNPLPPLPQGRRGSKNRCLE